ncbi:MAG: DUF1425 domain-containing protein [Hyphomonadaceae bacterium]|nr:DUF1425 domain-containing protein [Hyphomonadaceae bacterium]
MTLSRRAFAAALIGVAAADVAFAQDAGQTLEVNFETNGLGRRIELGPARFRAQGRYTMVEVQAQNTSSRDARIEYKIDWFDRDGFSVQTTSSWQSLTLSPRSFEAIRSVGQTAGAYSARLTIRGAD